MPPMKISFKKGNAAYENKFIEKVCLLWKYVSRKGIPHMKISFKKGNATYEIKFQKKGMNIVWQLLTNILRAFCDKQAS